MHSQSEMHVKFLSKMIRASWKQSANLYAKMIENTILDLVHQNASVEPTTQAETQK